MGPWSPLFLQVDESFFNGLHCRLLILDWVINTSPLLISNDAFLSLAMNKTDQCHPHVLLGLL